METDWLITTFEAPLGADPKAGNAFRLEVPTEHGVLEIILEVPEGVPLPPKVKIHRRFKSPANHESDDTHPKRRHTND